MHIAGENDLVGAVEKNRNEHGKYLSEHLSGSSSRHEETSTESSGAGSTLEGHPAGEHFICNRAECVLIGPLQLLNFIWKCGIISMKDASRERGAAVMRTVNARYAGNAVCLIIIALALLLPNSLQEAVANDTTIGFTGGSPYPLKSSSISLLQENLSLTLDKNESVVEVTYRLKNEGERCDVTIGFPYYTKKDLTYPDMGDSALGVSDFRCTVDGAPVEVKDSRGPDVLGMKDSFSTISWKTWQVSFNRGQTRTIYHRYFGSMGSSTGNATVTNMGVAFFEYILTTARNWKGPIGLFRLTVSPREPLCMSDIYGINYPGFERVKNSLVLEKKNFVPDRELFISVYGEYERRSMKGPDNWLNSSFSPGLRQAVSPHSSQERLTDSDLEPHTARELTIMRNEIYARHGRAFQDRELKSYFEAQDWYKANPSYRDADLSEVEKWNIRFILDFQKRKNRMW